MKDYIFIGRVLPYFPKGVLYPVVSSANPNKNSTFGFQINKSIVTATLTADHIENPDTALKSAEQTIQGLVDAYSFITGDVYEVRLEVVKTNNQEKKYKEASLEELLKDLHIEEYPKTELVMSAAVEHMSFRFALSNFKNARRYTAYTGLFVYLAIENIKKYFYPTDLKNESQEWEGLRKKLELKREDIDFAKSFADPVRHGKYQDVSGKDNTKILKIGVEIIYKFYLYLSNSPYRNAKQ